MLMHHAAAYFLLCLCGFESYLKRIQKSIWNVVGKFIWKKKKEQFFSSIPSLLYFQPEQPTRPAFPLAGAPAQLAGLARRPAQRAAPVLLSVLGQVAVAQFARPSSASRSKGRRRPSLCFPSLTTRPHRSLVVFPCSSASRTLPDSIHRHRLDLACPSRQGHPSAPIRTKPHPLCLFSQATVSSRSCAPRNPRSPPWDWFRRNCNCFVTVSYQPSFVLTLRSLRASYSLFSWSVVLIACRRTLAGARRPPFQAIRRGRFVLALDFHLGESAVSSFFGWSWFRVVSCPVTPCQVSPANSHAAGHGNHRDAVLSGEPAFSIGQV